MAGRHRRTFTYGLSSDSRAKQLYDKLTPRDALAFDLYDTKRILLEDEVYDSYARMRIQGYIDDYTSDEDFQEIFDKKADIMKNRLVKKERVMKYEIGRKRNIESNEKNKIFKKWN